MNRVSRSSIAVVAASLCLGALGAITACSDDQLTDSSFRCDTLIVNIDRTVLLVGETTHLNAYVTRRNGNVSPCPLVMPKTLAFSTSNAGIASVTDNADVLAVAPGTATISVKNGTLISAPITIRVVAQ